MRGRRIWIKCPDGTKVYACKALKYKGQDAQGVYHPETGDIEILAGAPETMRRRLFHEYVHKALDDMSDEEMRRIFDTENLEDAEEDLCLYLDKRLYELLTRDGHLAFPKPPLFK